MYIKDINYIFPFTNFDFKLFYNSNLSTHR